MYNKGLKIINKKVKEKNDNKKRGHHARWPLI